MFTFMNSGRKKVLRRFTAVMMAWIMVVTACAGTCSFVTQTSYAEDELGEASSVSVDDLRKNIDAVIKSVGDLKNIMTDNDRDIIIEIFSGFASGVSTVIGGINTATTILKLMGVMRDATGQSLAHITEQLDRITDQLNDMDKKLNEMSEQMTVMQANEDFTARAIKAYQMSLAWHNFEHDYMEDKMDELMNQYDTMMLNHISDWIEYRKEGSRQTDDYYLRTDKVVVLYKGGNPLDPNAKYTFTPAAVNNIDPDHDRRRVDNPDPYTMYADDDDFNTRFDRVLILDETFMPEKGAIRWNVNTYREDLEKFFVNKLKALKNGEFGQEHYSTYRINIEDWTEDDIETYACGVVDAIMYRINYSMVNESADFAKDVQKEFGEYVDNLKKSQWGLDSMLKTLYLTHAFEFEIAEDIKTFCDQMTFKTGVYSMFAINIMGMSEYITDKLKLETAEDMCDAIQFIKGSLNNALTGNGNYCYVTNTVLNYGDITFSDSARVDYYIRGAVYGYESYGAGPLKTTYSSDEAVTESTSLVGDSNALVIGYLLANNGIKFDHDFLNEHFSKTKRSKKSAVITSIRGEQKLTSDIEMRLKTHNVVGGYFHNDPEIFPKDLPGKAEDKYLVYRKMIEGSKLDVDRLALSKNQPLFGTAVYGESHFYWEVDESAIMGGPYGDPTYKDSFKTVKTSSGLFTDEYTASFTNSVQYNCLLSNPVKLLGVKPGPYPLEEFKTETAQELQDTADQIRSVRTELSAIIKEAKKVKQSDGWSEDDFKVFQRYLTEAEEVAGDTRSNLKELTGARDRLNKVWDYYRKDQKMTVSALRKTLKAKALKKSRKVIKAITVKDAKGKVTYTKVSVTKKKFAKKFTVNRKTGKITVAKGLKKGKYKVRVKVSAAGNGTFRPAVKTVTVKIIVK